MNMSPKDEKEKDLDQSRQDRVDTPSPPQVIDPSRPPGEGNYETYLKDEKKTETTRKVEKASPKPKKAESTHGKRR